MIRLSRYGVFLPRLHEIERDIHDHVFLTADHSAAAKLDQDFSRIDAVPARGSLRVTQEARINTRETER